MECNTDNKLKYRCGSITPSECVSYETTLPEWSVLEGCVTVEESLTEIYKKLTEIADSLVISDDMPTCLNYSSGEQTIASVLMDLANEICAIKNILDSAPNTFNVNTINTKCLTDTECGEEVSDLTGLLQVIIDNLCPSNN